MSKWFFFSVLNNLKNCRQTKRLFLLCQILWISQVSGW